MASGEREDGRERNKRATRRALRESSLELGLARGLAAVSTEDIARRAGVSPRTFFNYFDTKDDAALIELFTVTDEELSAFAAGDPAAGDPAAGVWADLVRMFVADVERAQRDGPDLPRYMQLHARHPGLQARQLGYFSAFFGKVGDAVAVRLGDAPHARLRAEVMAGSCITAVRVGLDRWAAHGGEDAASSHVTAAFAQFDGAFSTGVRPPTPHPNAALKD